MTVSSVSQWRRRTELGLQVRLDTRSIFRMSPSLTRFPHTRFLLLGALVVCLASGCGQMISRLEPTPTATPPPAAGAELVRRPTATSKPATPLPTPTLTPTPTPIIHTVQRGETLLGIAITYHISVEALQEANGIMDPKRLQLGQELVVPQDEAALDANAPTATPTPVPYEIENVGHYYTSAGTLWFLGEVHNTTLQPIEQVQVRVSLRAEDDALLGQSSAFVALDFVPAGARAPFAVHFNSPPDRFARYQVVALAGSVSTHPGRIYSNVSVLRYDGQPSGSMLTIAGEIKNTGDRDAEAIMVVVTGYDSANLVAAIRARDLPTDRLRPGDITPFEINLLSAGGAIVSYTVQVQAHSAG